MSINPFWRRFNWRGLTLQVLLFVVLPLGALLVAIPVVSLSLHGRAMRDLVTERDERAVRAAAAAVTEQLNHRAAAVRGLAYGANGKTPEAVLSDYAFLLPDFAGGLALFGTDGALLAASNPPPAWEAWPVSDLLSQAPASTEPRFSAVFVDASTSQSLMLVAARTPDGSAAVGAFAPASLGQKALGGADSTNGLPTVILVDARRQVLFQAGAPPLEPDPAQHAGVAEALSGQSGGTYLTVGGDEHVIAYSPVAPVNWALVVEEPWQAVDNPLLRGTQAAPLILVPALLFALLALGFGIRQIVQPLRQLEQQTSELAWGRFEAIERPVGGIAEIRHLQAELVHMAQRVKAAQQQLRSYLGAITAGQEDERRRLSHELHDGAVQSLVALSQRAQMAQAAVKAGSPEADERLSEMRQMTVDLIQEVRRVIRALRPNYLEDLGLLPALEMLTRDVQATAGVPVTFRASGPPQRLPPAKEIAVYRIVQEALNNAARYAQAHELTVSVTFTPAELGVHVSDDGRGFPAPERVSDLVSAGHYGLMGMQERAELIGGRLAIHSAPSSGTTIELHLPL